MENEKEFFGEVSFGEEADETLNEAFKEKQPEAENSNLALEFVDKKMVENEVMSDLDGKTTYGQFFRENKGKDVFPDEITDAEGVKNWYLTKDSPYPYNQAA
jgi:hypothetical protein